MPRLRSEKKWRKATVIHIEPLHPYAHRRSPTPPNSHFLDGNAPPPFSSFIHQSYDTKPRSGDRFGESVGVYENFLVVGCPGREDSWLHTGRVKTDWEGGDVGGVYLYRRDSSEKAFSFFQVRAP